MSKTIEDTAQEITDMFFEAGGRISKMHFDTVVAKLEERDRIARDEAIKKCKKAVYEEFAGAGEIWFPYIGCGAENRDEELEAVDEYWESIEEALLPSADITSDKTEV